jgi:putative nucleotidyltransferase with HDIG domain
MKYAETIKKHSQALLKSISEKTEVRWLIVLGTTLLITVLLFPSLWKTTPQYRIGDVAEQDIKSPKDFLIEDKAATKAKQDEAEASVPRVYDLDDTLVSKLEVQTSKAFDHLRNITAKLAEPISNHQADGGQSSDPAVSVPAQQPSVHDLVWQEKPIFEDILGIQISDGAYEVLDKSGFDASIPPSIGQLFRSVFQAGIVANKPLLLKEQDKGIIVRKLSSKEEMRVTDTRKYHSIDSAKVAVANSADEILKQAAEPLKNVIIELAQQLIQPNLTLNKGETEERRIKAIGDVKAVLTQIKRGEMLVREGEKVTPLHMAKLLALESEIKSKPVFTISTGFILLIIAFFAISFTVYSATETSPDLQNKDLLFLCSMLVVLFSLGLISTFLVKGIAKNLPNSIEISSAFYAIPAAAGPMTVCLVKGMGVAIPFAVSTACVVAFLFEDPFDMFIFLFLSGMVGAHSVRNCRERGVLVKAGLKVSLLSVVVITALHMFRGFGLEFKLVWHWAFGILGGISSGILTTGFAPVVEMVFSYTTDIKLLELANLDRPILRRLMLEAPGTYHHSVMVGNLVEAAAAAVGANPLLAKVGGYYHDIGKIKKPLYFIENQLPGQNKHDKLAPSMSSLILTSHIKDGVEIARRYKLGKVITDIIEQHHGTGLISFFYEKAKKIKGEHAVNVEHFRYPGPKPQTREAGLVLLADAVEASSRTLENPTPARIKGQVQKIIHNLLLAGQLDDCELTLKDLSKIADSFNKTLTGIYHHRIEYPNGNGTVKAEFGRKSLQDEYIRRQPPDASSDRSRENSREGRNPPKQLGIT